MDIHPVKEADSLLLPTPLLDSLSEYEVEGDGEIEKDSTLEEDAEEHGDGVEPAKTPLEDEYREEGVGGKGVELTGEDNVGFPRTVLVGAFCESVGYDDIVAPAAPPAPPLPPLAEGVPEEVVEGMGERVVEVEVHIDDSLLALPPVGVTVPPPQKGSAGDKEGKGVEERVCGAFVGEG